MPPQSPSMNPSDTAQLQASPPAPRILVVEDEEKTLASVAEGFRLEGWEVVTARNGDEAVGVLESAAFDLVVLDWMLPGCDGVDVLRHARARGQRMPVMMLTARHAVDDRVVGLESGADDYLPKPFAYAELLARCRAMLRRSALSSGTQLGCGDLQLDTRARIAKRAGTEIQLTPREVDILEYLMRCQGQVVTREMLEREVWKQSRRFSSLDNVIDVQMMRLRRKIDPEGSIPLIHTLRGVGYQLGDDRP